MNRRTFLTRALAAVPVILAGQQLLELLAPERTIFLPPRGGWATGPALYRVGDVVIFDNKSWPTDFYRGKYRWVVAGTNLS